MHHVHIHYHPDEDKAERLCRIESLLGELIETQENLMPTLADIQTTLGVIDGKVATVKTDVDTLLAKIAAIPGGLTPEQQAAIDDIAQHVQGIATSLGAIDAEVNPPTP